MEVEDPGPETGTENGIATETQSPPAAEQRIGCRRYVHNKKTRWGPEGAKYPPEADSPRWSEAPRRGSFGKTPGCGECLCSNPGGVEQKGGGKPEKEANDPDRVPRI